VCEDAQKKTVMSEIITVELDLANRSSCRSLWCGTIFDALSQVSVVWDKIAASNMMHVCIEAQSSRGK
jgi:hypothetical protein